nr:MAG TPA: hypothetical protein [Caudoviricetes sp.]
MRRGRDDHTCCYYNYTLTATYGGRKFASTSQRKIALVKFDLNQTFTGGGSFRKKLASLKNRPPNQFFTHDNFSENIGTI